jgi:transcriptional regulator with XRE-family HTH domain
VDNRNEVKAFLSTRRAKLSPEQAGLADYGRTRRVPGLRRSEVADLAGVSVEYYARLERGNLAGVSETVLDALARALQMDEAERVHLAHLARAAGPGGRARRTTPAQQVRPSLARILAGMTEVPAIVNSGTLDLLAANRMGRALFAPVFAGPGRPVNHARFCFLDPRARDFWLDWGRAADDSVAALRAQEGRDPHDKRLTDLVGELATRSDAFRVRWAAHDVRLHRTGVKSFHHPVVGNLHLSFEVLEPAADPGMSLIGFSAEAGSPAEDALKLLASWWTTSAPADPPARVSR